jgi:hypothetical protein
MYARPVVNYLRTGTFEADLLDAPYEVRAALELVRSRIASLPAAEKTKLVAAATRDDLLHGVVTTAIHAWR